MKMFGIKKLLPMLIPVFLSLSAAAPTLSPQALFGTMRDGQPVLVYSFVWVPILELSIMIAQRILPPNGLTAAKGGQEQQQAQNPSATTDYAFSVPLQREPVLLRKVTQDASAMNAILASARIPLPSPCAPPAPRDTGILLFVALVFLFKPIMPRSDIPR